MRQAVTVTVPASTANLGPGFDCLGLALALYNTFHVRVLGPGTEVRLVVTGEGAGQLQATRENLLVQAIDAVWRRAGLAPVGLEIQAQNAIPLGSGLGSSSAAVVGGVAAANALLGGPLAPRAQLLLAQQLEGHPDNAAAALYGGLTLVSLAGDALPDDGAGDLLVAALEVPPLDVAVALPDVRLSTREARAALPERVPRHDAVFNVGRALFVVQALQAGDYAMLGRAMVDRLHEPYRAPLIPGFYAAVEAARAAGAAAVALSGAGPSVAAFAPGGHAAIAAAMQRAFEASGVACRTFVLPVDRHGVMVE